MGDARDDGEAIEQRIAHAAARLETIDLTQRRAAARYLFDLCREARDNAGAAIPVLLRVLADRDERVGESALSSLAYCAPASIQPLIECLDDADAIVRQRACRALASIGQPAIGACDALRRRLDDSAAAVRSEAARRSVLCATARLRPSTRSWG